MFPVGTLRRLRPAASIQALRHVRLLESHSENDDDDRATGPPTVAGIKRDRAGRRREVQCRCALGRREDFQMRQQATADTLTANPRIHVEALDFGAIERGRGAKAPPAKGAKRGPLGDPPSDTGRRVVPFPGRQLAGRIAAREKNGGVLSNQRAERAGIALGRGANHQPSPACRACVRPIHGSGADGSMGAYGILRCSITGRGRPYERKRRPQSVIGSHKTVARRIRRTDFYLLAWRRPV